MTNLPNYLLFHDFDLFGVIQATTGHPTGMNFLDRKATLYLLALLGQGIRSGLFILIFRQYFRGVPMELEQAAMVDGCGFGKTYFRIMLPNAKGPMLITFLFTLVWYWSDFYTLSTYLSNVRTLSVSLASLRISLETVMSVEAWDPYKIITMEQAACIASIMPLLLFFLIFQRQFAQSIETTGLVG
jgi:multiple sugar transport system permease protein